MLFVIEFNSILQIELKHLLEMLTIRINLLVVISSLVIDCSQRTIKVICILSIFVILIEETKTLENK